MMSYFQEGGHDVILCRKVIPSGESNLPRRCGCVHSPLAILSTVPIDSPFVLVWKLDIDDDYETTCSLPVAPVTRWLWASK